MTASEAAERLHRIIDAWSKMPLEVQQGQTTLMVLRAPDFEAMRIAVLALRAKP